MSQRQQPTLGDLELNMHDKEQDSNASRTIYIRELKAQLNGMSQQIQATQSENQRLKDRYEPKKPITKKDLEDKTK